MGPRRESVFTDVILALFGYLVQYFAYSFLTTAVLSAFAALMIVYITFRGPDVPFLEYLSFILPLDSRGSAVLGASDIMRVYSLLTLVLLVLSLAARALFKRAFRPAARGTASTGTKSRFVQGLKAGSIVISVIYAAAFFALPFAETAEGQSRLAMYLMLVAFYVIAMVSNAIYSVVNGAAERILGRVKSGL